VGSAFAGGDGCTRDDLLLAAGALLAP